MISQELRDLLRARRRFELRDSPFLLAEFEAQERSTEPTKTAPNTVKLTTAAAAGLERAGLLDSPPFELAVDAKDAARIQSDFEAGKLRQEVEPDPVSDEQRDAEVLEALGLADSPEYETADDEDEAVLMAEAHSYELAKEAADRATSKTEEPMKLTAPPSKPSRTWPSVNNRA